MTNFTPYNTRRGLLDDLQKEANPFEKTYVQATWNHHVFDSPLWWLVPSRSSPAFCDTKFVVRTSYDKTSDDILVGIHAEKGAGAKYAPFVPKQWAMNDRWHWHRFRELVDSGTVPSALLGASIALDAPIRITFHTYPIQMRSDVESEIYDIQKADDRPAVSEIVHYLLHPNSDLLELEEDPPRLSGSTMVYPPEFPLEELGKQLRQFDEDHFSWFDLWITAAFTPTNAPERTASFWDAKRIWREYLSPLEFAVGAMKR